MITLTQSLFKLQIRHADIDQWIYLISLYQIQRMERELKILNKLDHPNVIKLLGKIVHEEIEVYSMVFPWMDRGDLENCLPMIRERRVSFSRCLKILCDVSAGLEYLHMQDKPIIHGDLSSGNILFDSEGRAYLSDFGMATVLTDRQTYQTTTQCENYRWCAPEYYSILEENLNPTCEADVYSFGSIMYTVLSGKKPYHNIDPNSLIKHVVIDGKVPTRDHSIEKTQWEMIKKCWNKDPKKRPKISEVAAKIQEWYAEAVKDSPDDHPESNDLWDSQDPSDPGSMFPNPRTMFILDFPPGTTHTDLFNFLHLHHTLQMLSWQDRGSLASSPTFCCPRCPKSLCMSSCKQSAFALYDDEEHLREALNNISNKKWDADEPKSPSLICRPRKNEDTVKNGTAVYIQWAPDSVVPEFVPYRPTRTFLMRALKTVRISREFK
ncbi:kinase-like domain-containing protein [Flammula alnicola]|nr:kinase-like domain-containing protein [Flammula alnicola]